MLSNNEQARADRGAKRDISDQLARLLKHRAINSQVERASGCLHDCNEGQATQPDHYDVYRFRQKQRGYDDIENRISPETTCVSADSALH